jgi:hypothetical protein
MRRVDEILLGSVLLSISCTESDPVTTGVPAIVDQSRPEHFFDHPFPSDALSEGDGRPDMSGYPVAGVPMMLPVIEGWRDRAAISTDGFSNGGAIYFRFEGALSLPSTTEGLVTDPVLLINLDTHELHPLDIRFTESPLGDPTLADNLLAMSPRIGHLPASGARLAAVVMGDAGAAPPATRLDGEDDELLDALTTAGVDGDVAVATIFRTQDGTAQLRTLASAADAWIDLREPQAMTLKRVVHISYSQGSTPSGNDATVFTARFDDESEEITYIAPLNEEEGNHEIDLLTDWPMAVYQGHLAVPNFSGLADRPYMSPGLTHFFDSERTTGWIDFHDGELLSFPDEDQTRVVISLPLDSSGEPLEEVPVVLYDHGTGGHAYNSVQRRNLYDDGHALAQILADEGVAIIGRDAPLYGTRYPLIDEGYGASLGFYNIANPPAFRDNQRQTAIEGLVLMRYIEEQLNDVLPAGSVDSSRVRRMGHSMGSVTSNLGVAATPEVWDSVFLSGTGGLFMEYFLQTGLIHTIDPAVFDSLFALLGADAPSEITPANVLGAGLDLPPEAWPAIDRLHPLSTLFQWMMDPSDPMTVARDEQTPALVFIGVGDWQVPNFTSEALSEALPIAQVVECVPTWDYDPHYCLHREQEGYDAFRTWLQEFD